MRKIVVQRVGSASAGRRGAALVETAVVLPFLLLLLFGVWEVGRLIHVSQIISNSAREGARLAATGLYSSSSVSANQFEVQRAIANYIHNSGLPISSTGVIITVRNETRNTSAAAQATSTTSTGQSVQIAVTASGAVPAKDPTLDSGISQFDRLRIDVVYPFSFARWSPNNLFFYLGPNRNVAATTRWLNLRDKPINLNSTIPNKPY